MLMHGTMLVKACACPDGMKLVDKLGVAKLCIDESDCLELVQLWEIKHACHPMIAPILR